MSRNVPRRFRGLKMTTTISGMALFAVAVAVAAVVMTVVLLLSEQSRRSAGEKLDANMRVAAAILEVNLPSSDVYWNDNGTLGKIEAKAMQKMRGMLAAVELVQVTEMGPATAVMLAERVAAGGFVAIVGDRTPVQGGRSVTADFLGHRAPFPIGAARWRVGSDISLPRPSSIRRSWSR